MVLQDITPLASSGRLQKVVLNLTDQDFPYVSQLIPFSQDIRTLSLSGYISPSEILAFIKFPHLANISVDFDLRYFASASDQDRINQSVSCLFQSLPSIPHLDRLRLELPNWAVLPIIPPNMFSKLTTFALVGSAAIVSQVLSSTTPNKSPCKVLPQHIILGFTDVQFTENVLANRQSSIQNLAAYSGLSCLTLTTIDGSSLKALIGPILGLPLMKSLTVECNRGPAPCDLDDLDVRQIVQAWPILERLTIHPFPQDPRDRVNGMVSKISLCGVRSLAKLKRLRVLSIRAGRREVTLPCGYYHKSESSFDSYMDHIFTFSQLYGPFFAEQ